MQKPELLIVTSRSMQKLGSYGREDTQLTLPHHTEILPLGVNKGTECGLRRCLHTYVHSSIIYSIQKVDTVPFNTTDA